MTRPPPKEDRDRAGWLWFAVTALVFIPAVRGQFLNWDDNDWILNNPLVVVPGGESWTAIWTGPCLGAWYPLYLSALKLLWGLGTGITNLAEGDPQLTAAWTWIGGQPALFHLASIFGFATAVLLWHECLRRLGISPAGRALAVAWFALHPLRVESVAWATAMRDVLSLMFLVLSLRLHLSEREGRRRWLAPAAFTAALLCKSMVFALAPAPLLIDLLWRKRPRRESLVASAPYLVIASGGAIASFLAYRSVLQENLYVGGSLLRSLPIIGATQLRYARLQLCPWDLAALPSAPAGGAIGWLAIALGLALLGACVWWAWRGRTKPLALCLLYFLPMGPICGLMPLAWPVADRYTLLPSLAVALGLGWVATHTRFSRVALPTAGVVAAAWAIITILYIPTWGETERLWSRSLDLFPREWASHMNYAGAVGGKGRMEEAAHHLYVARELVGEKETDRGQVAEMLMFAELLLANQDLQAIQGHRGRFIGAAGDPDLLGSLAIDLASSGLEAPCEVVIHHAEEMGAASHAAHLARSVLAERRRDWPRVLYHADRGLRSAPDDVHLLTMETRAWIQLGGAEAARDAAERLAAQLDGADPDVILARMSGDRR